jgi:hypothetical protein
LPYLPPSITVNPKIYAEHQRQERKKDLLVKVQGIYEYLVRNQVQDWDCDLIQELSKNPFRDLGELLDYHLDRIISTQFGEVPQRHIAYNPEYTATDVVKEDFHYCLQECTWDPVLETYVFPPGHRYYRTWN